MVAMADCFSSDAGQDSFGRQLRSAEGICRSLDCRGIYSARSPPTEFIRIDLSVAVTTCASPAESFGGEVVDSST